jgi:DNA adenine methylase
MKYMGSKARIAKYILPIILSGREDGQYYVEPLGGGANTISLVSGNRIYNDHNYPLTLCLKALSTGWIPPKEISREMYSNLRAKWRSGQYTDEEAVLIGYVGINGSYGGRWFDGGYAGITKTKDGKERNYPLEAWKNVMGQAQGLRGIEFQSDDYKLFHIPPKSRLYCDPPYRGTKEYESAKKSGFDSDEFWQWCRYKKTEGHVVFVSEYSAPDDFVCVWEKGNISSSLRANSVISGAKKSTERLFTI